MLVIGSVVITNGSTNTSITTANTASFTLRENVLTTIDVRSQSSSAGTLVEPVITGSGGETWVRIGAQVFGTVRYLTRYATIVAADTTTTVTMNYGAGKTQSLTGWQVCGHSSTAVGATAAASFVSASVTGGTAGSGTSISFAIPTALSAYNAQFASYFGTSGAQTNYIPRTGWTEIAERQVSGEGALELQLKTDPLDTTAGCSVTPGPVSWAGLCCELIGSPNPIATTLAFHYDGSPGTIVQTHNITVHKNCYYILHIQDNAGVPVPTCPDTSWTLDQDHLAAGNHDLIYRSASKIAADGTMTLTVTRAAAGGNYAISVIELNSVSSFRQLTAETWGAGPHTFTFPGAIQTRNSPILVVWHGDSAGSGAGNPGVGWQWKNEDINGTMGGTFHSMGYAWRSNGRQSPVVSDATAVSGAGVAYELTSAASAGGLGVVGGGPWFPRLSQRRYSRVGNIVF